MTHSPHYHAFVWEFVGSCVNIGGMKKHTHTPFKPSSFKRWETLEKGRVLDWSEVVDALVFNADGLIPAIAQQHDSKAVLMMAWMNKTALLETLQTGHVCYYSRSRQTLWRKGESSGHVQTLRSLHIDCDGDTLLLQVDQKGSACHTMRPDCFYFAVNAADNQVVITSHSNEN